MASSANKSRDGAYSHMTAMVSQKRIKKEKEDGLFSPFGLLLTFWCTFVHNHGAVLGASKLDIVSARFNVNAVELEPVILLAHLLLTTHPC